MKSMQIRRTFTLAVAAITLVAAAASAQSEWNSGTITYNGLGNIVAMGQDVYLYDSAGRLVSGSAGGTTANRQEYSYDEFGNRLAVTTYGTGCIGGCATTAAVSTGTNHMTDHNATYDLAGNTKTFGSSAYAYDGAGMVSRVTEGSAIDWQFVYTAGDERLATYTGQGNWRFTVRDVDGEVMREVTAYQGGSGTSWTLDRDHVYRDGVLLASVYPSGQRQQFHLDHLGTPRLVTDSNGAQIGTHTLYPFGDELSSGTDESPLSRFKFTGHERDALVNREPLDDMHMRFFSPPAGRFLSTDPLGGDPERPATWNRYAYVANNPCSMTDPFGAYSEEITVTARDPLWDMVLWWFLFGPSGSGASGGGGGGGAGGSGSSGNGPVNGNKTQAPAPCYGHVKSFMKAHMQDAQTLASRLGHGVTATEVLATSGEETGWGGGFGRDYNNYFGIHGSGPAGSHAAGGDKSVKIAEFFPQNGYLASGQYFVKTVGPYMQPGMGENPLAFFGILHQHGYAVNDPNYAARMVANRPDYHGPFTLAAACAGSK